MLALFEQSMFLNVRVELPLGNQSGPTILDTSILTILYLLRYCFPVVLIGRILIELYLVGKLPCVLTNPYSPVHPIRAPP